MSAKPLLRLRALGQSAWLDDIQRGLIERGGLERLIREDGLAGVTSNPAIFEKAITQGREYEAPIRDLLLLTKLHDIGKYRRRHSRESGNPEQLSEHRWIPAFAGMTGSCHAVT